MTHTPLTAIAAPLLRWSAPIEPRITRGKRWYMSAGALGIVLVAYGVATSQWIFTLVTVLIAGMYILTRRSEPRTKTIVVEKRGITFDAHFTSFDDIQDFWMLQGEGYIELHVSSKIHRREIVIQLGDLEMQTVRAVLGQFLTERSDQREKTLDTIIRICKL